MLLTAAVWIAAFVLPSSPPLFCARRRSSCPTCGAEPAKQARSSFFDRPRASSGVEAFANTKWSMMMTIKDSGTVLFSTHLLDDLQTRFSDTDKLGEWECEQDFVVVEKPEALYNNTLYLSARLQMPTPEQPRLRLVDGVVQQSFPIEGSADEVELRQVGTFGGHEQLEDAGMNKFKEEE